MRMAVIPTYRHCLVPVIQSDAQRRLLFFPVAQLDVGLVIKEHLDGTDGASRCGPMQCSPLRVRRAVDRRVLMAQYRVQAPGAEGGGASESESEVVGVRCATLVLAS